MFFTIMEKYYLVHGVLSEKYGVNHVRTIDENSRVFEVLSGKCSDSCSGVTIEKDDLLKEDITDDGWVPVFDPSVMMNDPEWETFRLWSTRREYEAMRREHHERRNSSTKQTCDQLRTSMKMKGYQFDIRERDFIEDGCRSASQFANHTHMKPEPVRPRKVSVRTSRTDTTHPCAG